VTNQGPLPRKVPVRPATWLPWLRDGTRDGRRSSYDLEDANSEAAVAFLEEDLGGTHEGPTAYVDRCRLQELAVDAARSRTSDRLVKLFVATMMWGSGTTNGRGPRRTAEALNCTGLAETLRMTQEAVFDGDLERAHSKFYVSGIGESFFTKWLWATSLGAESTSRPLILDYRVRSCLHARLRNHPGWTRLRGAAGYVNFVSLVHTAADLLPDSLGEVDAEKIEWLLFDRQSHDSIEPCLSSWAEKVAHG